MPHPDLDEETGKRSVPRGSAGELRGGSLCARSLMSNSSTPWTVAHQAPLSMGWSQARTQEWVALPSSRGSS